MDINIIPVSGSSQQIPIVTPKASTDTAPLATPQTQVPAEPVVPVSANDNSTATSDNTQSQYEMASRQAALSFKNVYAVSDSDFSIFKDASGKYITRYVSLRDGKVTYIPEPTLIKQMQIEGGGNTTRLSINA